MRPTREHATNTSQTYMVTSATWDRLSLFRNERWAGLLIDVLYHYRRSAFMLHEFVVVPDHVHVLITPKTSLEKAVQFIKGGFSYRAKKELGSNLEVWQKGFSDHRIRDAEDYLRHAAYIRENPVRTHLCERAKEYPYSSAHPGFELDAVPQGLKPQDIDEFYGAPEGAPFQDEKLCGVEATPFQTKKPIGASEASLNQNKRVASVTFQKNSRKIAS
ncbi:MAG TPA: transposase [Candidatus Eremiobacteraceae bacterium]|nr:transposase [Candidatus Eremiobacteraceae bacterium]